MSAQQVTLTANENATIYYTTDDTEPTTSSSVYSGPITVSADTVLKFFAVDEVGNTGLMSTEQYTVCNGSKLKISGVVKDATLNKGIPLAIITLNTGQQVIGDANGNYSFTGLSRGYYRIEDVKVTAPGFVAYQKDLELCKTDVVNDIVLTTVNTVFGVDTNSGYSLDAVNTSAGNYIYQVADHELPGRGIPFTFERSYNSQDENNGPLGYGWTHNYNITLIENAGSDVSIRWGDGKVETWIYNSTTSEYEPRYGVFSTLIKNSDGTITLKQKDLLEYSFDTFQRMASLVDENGNTIIFTYENNKLTTITDTVGRIISLEYDASGRITRILDPIGRSTTYEYDVNGDMASSTDLNGNTSIYTYNADHQLLTITDPLGNVEVTIAYDDQRRVVSSQRDALGAEILYSYDVVNKKTQIIDPNGNVSYHYFDNLLRLVKEEDSAGNSATYVYDSRGNLESVTDKNGNITSYQYDDKGNVLVKTDPLGNQTSATYNALNNPVSKTDANSNVTSYTYDTKGNVLTISNPMGDTITFTYNSYGQLQTDTDAMGGISTSQYDEDGNLVSITDPLGNVSTFVYDPVGRKLAEFHPLGRAIAYEYDNMDQIISVTDTLGNTSTMKYDVNGNKTEHIDAKGNITTFAYDAKNRLLSKTDPMGGVATYTYDKLDRRTSMTNPNGGTTRLTYDNLGNVIQEIDAEWNRIQHEYDANGNRTKTIDAKGNEITFMYDELNRLISTTDPLGNSTKYTYDANGNRLSVTDALGQTTKYSYDTMNLLKTVTDPLENDTTNEYDALGRLITVTDGRGNVTGFEYDALGRMTKVTDAAGGILTVSYDVLGNMLSVTDARGNITTYTYDVLNRLVSETDPLGNTQTMNYDDVGNLTSLNDANGTTIYSYDRNNRLINITYPDSTTVEYVYDANGNRLSVTDMMGKTAYTYTLLDQIETVTDPFGKTVGYTYDSNGNRTSIKYPGNKAVFYYYDDLDRMIAVEDWGGISTFYTYDEAGRLTIQIMGNGSMVTYTYDKAGRLVRKEDNASSGTVITSYSYTLDEVGNRTGLDMTQPLVPKLDAIDNTYTHNSGNQVTATNSTTYTYDDKGNRISRDDGAVTIHYAYNYDNRLVQVFSGAGTTEYRYNSDGHRLATDKDGVETRYLLDVNGDMEYVLADMDGSSNIKKYYVYGDGLLYSVDALTSKRLFYHYDPIGSTVAVADSDENVIDKYAYLPFGEITRSETVNENPFTYVGKFGVTQEPNNLYFMRARFYDLETGTFISKDPMKGDLKISQTMNPYLYALNNPILHTDPQGEIVPALIAAYGIYKAVSFSVDFSIAAYKTWKSSSEGDFKTTSKIIAKSAVTSFMKNHPINAVIGGYEAASGKSPLGCHINIECYAGYAYGKVVEEGTYKLVEKAIGFDIRDINNTNTVTKNQSSDLKSVNYNSINMTRIDAKKVRKSTENIIYRDLDDPNSWASIKAKTQLRRAKEKEKVAMRIYEKAASKGVTVKEYLREKRKEDRARERARRKAEERRLYILAARTYSKYSVLILDMTRKPDFKSDSIISRGIYGGK